MKSINRNHFIALNMLAMFAPVCIQAQGLRLLPGIHWVNDGAPSLVLNNAGLINDGDLVAGSSTIIFTGDASAAGSFIGGGNPISFYNVIISRSLHDVQLGNDAAVSGIITLDSGNLQLNDHTLDLGSSGYIMGERANSCITGTDGGVVKVTALLFGPRSVNPGNIGVELTSDQDLGSTVISRGHVRQTSSGVSTGIQRYFDIVPAVNAHLDASLRFYYLEGELAGNNKDALTLFSTADGGNWSLSGRDRMNAEGGWVVKDHLDVLHRFTLAVASKESYANKFAQIFPNPTHDVFTVVLTSPGERDVIAGLYDQTGNVLETRKMHCIAGVNSIGWDIAHLAAGVYHLEFRNMEMNSVKIIKL